MNIENNTPPSNLIQKTLEKGQDVEPFPIKNLPQEIIMYIFGFLDIKELLQVSRVDHFCSQLAADDTLWKAIARRIDGLANRDDAKHKVTITSLFKKIVVMADRIGVFFPENLKASPNTSAKLEMLIPYLSALHPDNLVEDATGFETPEPITVIKLKHTKGYALSADEHAELAGYMMSRNIIEVWSKIAEAAQTPHQIPDDFNGSCDSKNVNASFSQWIEQNLNMIKTIENLNLSMLDLVYLPDELQFLTNLKKLNLDFNPLSFLPPWIGDLTKLKILSVNDTLLSAFPDSVQKLKSLTTLNLKSNDFDHVPEPIKYLRNLEVLGLDDNKISKIPDWIGSLTNIKHLDLNDNSITHLPQTAERLKNLLILRIFNNELSKLPPCLCELDNLRQLSIDAGLYPSLSPIPDNKLTKLRTLYIFTKQNSEPNINHINLGRDDIHVTTLEG